MSRTTERAFDALRDTVFEFKDNKTIEIRNAFIFWTNFRGEQDRFKNSARAFNLAITQEVADELRANGWRVRDVIVNEETGDILYFVNIKVNMKSNFPPLVTLYTEFKGKKSRKSLDIETIGELDRTNIQSADCIINAYESKTYPGKVTGYLKKLNVIQEPDIEFGGKYDDWATSDDFDLPSDEK